MAIRAAFFRFPSFFVSRSSLAGRGRGKAQRGAAGRIGTGGPCRHAGAEAQRKAAAGRGFALPAALSVSAPFEGIDRRPVGEKMGNKGKEGNTGLAERETHRKCTITSPRRPASQSAMRSSYIAFDKRLSAPSTGGPTAYLSSLEEPPLTWIVVAVSSVAVDEFTDIPALTFRLLLPRVSSR